MTTFCVVDALVTASPFAKPTCATVPAIGDAIVACATACCATASSSDAASTAFWYEIRSSAEGERDPPPALPFPSPPLPAPPVEDPLPPRSVVPLFEPDWARSDPLGLDGVLAVLAK